MKKSQKTKVGILEAAKALFWTKGYSNVNLREIAKQAGVDVALIPRYFGNKEGLFNATLDYAFEWNKWDSIPAEDLIEFLVDGYVSNSHIEDDVTVMRMLVIDSMDPKVGDLVRENFEKKMKKPLIQSTKGILEEINIELIASILIGISQARKAMKFPELRKLNHEQLKKVLMSLINAAEKVKISY